MRLSVRSVLDQLVREGLATPGFDEKARAALAPELADDLPWYVRSAVAVGAWFSTAFLLFSLFAIAGIRDERASTVVGVLLIAAGIFVRRQAQTEYLRWSGVALTLAGLGMTTFGVNGFSGSATVAAGICLALSIVIIWQSPDATLRFLSTLATISALFVWLIGIDVPYALDVGIALVVAALAYVWRGRLAERGDRLTEILTPVGYGLIVAFFAVLLVRTLATSTHGSWSMDLSGDVARIGALATVACTAALVALTWKVLDEHGASLSAPVSFGVLGGSAALGSITLDSPGIVAGVAMLMLAFDRRNRVLLGTAAIFLIVFGSFYYYSLELTLLEKSGVLVGSGLVLLGVRGKAVDA